MRKILIPALLLASLYSCGQEEAPEQAASLTVNPADAAVAEIIATGKIEPEGELATLAAASGGLVEKIFRQDGDSMRANELLVQLDDELERLRIAELNAQLATQQTQVAIEQASLRETEVKLRNKTRLLASGQRLLDKGAETAQSVEDLQTEVSMLEAAAERLQTSVRLAQSRLEEIRQQRLRAEAERARKQLRAPFAGIILDMKASPGAALSQYASYAEVAPQGPNVVRAEVDELFADRLQLGQQVEIRYTGTDQIIATGTITRLAPYLKKKSLFSENASDQEDRRVREVRIGLKTQQGLIINAKVECVIKL